MSLEDLEEFKLSEEVVTKLKNPAHLKKMLEEGKRFHEIFGFSEETMNKFYTAAYNLFNRREYEKAADAFYFLTTLDSEQPHYWLGLGLSEQFNHEFESSILALGMCIRLDVSNPLPHYHLAKAYHAQHDEDNARAAIQLCLKFAEEGENPLIKEKAEAFKRQL